MMRRTGLWDTFAVYVHLTVVTWNLCDVTSAQILPPAFSLPPHPSLKFKSSSFAFLSSHGSTLITWYCCCYVVMIRCHGNVHVYCSDYCSVDRIFVCLFVCPISLSFLLSLFLSQYICLYLTISLFSLSLSLDLNLAFSLSLSLLFSAYIHSLPLPFSLSFFLSFVKLKCKHSMNWSKYLKEAREDLNFRRQL